MATKTFICKFPRWIKNPAYNWDTLPSEGRYKVPDLYIQDVITLKKRVTETNTGSKTP